MKWGIILILCILLSSGYVFAENVRLEIGDSHEREGVNITLAKFSGDFTKAILCVNNEKLILKEDQFAYFRNAALEIVDIDRHDMSIEIDIDWVSGCGIDCKCEDNCTNPDCKINIYDEFGKVLEKFKEEENETIDEFEKIEDVKVKEFEVPNYFLIIGFGIIGGIIGLALVWLFWLRQVTF